MKVSRSSYYQWLNDPESTRDTEDNYLIERIKSIFQISRKRYGSRRIRIVLLNEGWLYLATVIDLYSRKIVCWSMDNNMKTELVNKALLMAIWTRKPDSGLIWHTDGRNQYVADSHLRIIKQHDIIQSMSRKGNCWDNAVAESFFIP